MTEPPSGRRLCGIELAFDDVETDDWFDTPKHAVMAEEIDRFAEITGDHFAIHMSDAAAQKLGFPSRVAHGLLVLSIVDGLKNRSDARFAAVASLGWDWHFLRPVLVGDMLGARIAIAGKRETRKRDRGILMLKFTVTDQTSRTVQAGTNVLMVRRSPAEPPVV